MLLKFYYFGFSKEKKNTYKKQQKRNYTSYKISFLILFHINDVNMNKLMNIEIFCAQSN